MMKEIHDKIDIHGNNQKDLNLPTRLIAKTFVFRLIYGGTCWAYARDPDFASVNKTAKQWQTIIDAFYEKYEGIRIWHTYLMHEATTTGRIVIPTGRFFTFKPYPKNGGLEWPVTTIKNYPVQGLGADLVCLARVKFHKRFMKEKVNGVPISSIHDSLVCDIHNSERDHTAHLLRSSVSAIPTLFQERFGEMFNLPLSAEIKVGPNCKDMQKIT